MRNKYIKPETDILTPQTLCGLFGDGSDGNISLGGASRDDSKYGGAKGNDFDFFDEEEEEDPYTTQIEKKWEALGEW